jgi:hypothetical protein
LPDLIAHAPESTEKPAETVTPVADAKPTEGAPVAEEKKPEKPAVTRADYLKKVEEAIAAEHEFRESKKAADALQAKLGKYAVLDEHLTKGERAAAIKALLGDKFDEGVLYELAGVLTPKEKTAEEIVEEKLAARDAAAKADAAKTEKERAEKELSAYMVRSANFLKTNLDKFPLCKAWGVDDARYQTLLAEYAEKHGDIPDPEVLVKAIEAEHTAMLKKAGITPAAAIAAAETASETGEPDKLRAHADAAFNKHRPKNVDANGLVKKLSPVEEAKEDLRRYEKEKNERIKFGQGMA